MHKKSPSPTIGIMTALPKEHAAVSRLLAESRQISEENDSTIYTIGYLNGEGGRHCVVLACMSKYANNTAAITSTNMVRSFPTIRDIVMVGIAAGVPRPDKKEIHVRLGDVVISSGRGVIQFDIGAYKNGTYEVRDTSPPPSARLLQAVNYLESAMLLNKFNWDDYISTNLLKHKLTIPSKEPKKGFRHPSTTKKNTIHRGKIAASNSLIKDATKRDHIVNEHGVIAFEMEGSGIADATWDAGIGYLLIRGICDYGDENKEDSWQEYAANIAAFYCAALLTQLLVETPCDSIQQQNYISTEQHNNVFVDCRKVNVSHDKLTACDMFGELLYVGGFTGHLYEINPISSLVQKDILVSNSVIRCILTIESYGILLIGNDDGEIICYHIASGNVVAKQKLNSPVFTIAYTENNRFITGDKGGNISEFELVLLNSQIKMHFLRVLIHHNSIVFSIKYNMDTRSAISVGSNGMYLNYDFTMGNVDIRKVENNTLFSISISNSGIVAIGESTGKLLLAKPNEEFIEWRGHVDAIRKVVISKQSRWIITGSKDGTVRAWSVGNGNVFVLYRNNNYIYDMLLSPKGECLYLVDALGDVIMIPFGDNIDTLSSIK